jgi:hypothetical protein
MCELQPSMACVAIHPQKPRLTVSPCQRAIGADRLQTLKERFAEQLPEKIEQIKKLRK